MAAARKAKVVLAQPAAGAPSRAPLFSRAHAPVRGSGDEAAYRARLRYQGLLRDYQELLKETEAKRRRLHMVRLKKQWLLAEVKFLRKRCKSLSENPSQTIVCRVRNPAMPRSVHGLGSSSKSQLAQLRVDSPLRMSPVIDLNETCEPGYEFFEIKDHHGSREPLSIDKAKMYAMEGDAAAAGPSQVRMPAFWDVRNPAGRAGKRKISWQDQLALRV